ncbi:MAG: DUF2085 domain-containing protein [Promethearchaeota archaeon]|jgi:uncharacterized membrane protein
MSIEKKKKFTLRLTFVNIIIVVFIVMSYFYVSETFGSISTPFVNNSGFSLVFGVSLLLYTFFSILAGPIKAFIAGFWGEFLFQLASDNNILFDWCIIIALYGMLAGLYKYKPLKYKKIRNVFYTILILVIDSVMVMLSITIFQVIIYSSVLQFELLFINFGFKFFLEALLSVIIIVPFMLIIYDKFLATKERDLYYLLLTHHEVSASDHTFFFQFGRTKVYFCSRCSGMVIGVILSIFFVDLVQSIFNPQFSSEVALLITIIFPIPGLIDWGTQKLRLRTSTTGSRIFTGFIIGVAAYFISFTGEYYFLTIIIVTFYFVVLIILIFFGQRILIREVKKELTPDPTEDFDFD